MGGGVYYDWQRTLTYNAKVNMIISARGFGKTYGIRKQAIKDFIKDGSKFVEVVRYKELLKGESAIQIGYFDKLVLNNEFPGYEFKIQGTKAYICTTPKEGQKAKWHHMGYFVALTEMQQTKQRTFAGVKNVIFDEFVIDKRTGHRYLKGEYFLFANLIDSLAREEVGKDGKAMGTKIRIYLLGNACDLTNPYFVQWKINKQPRDGYTWYANKLVLLHYVKNKTYQEGKKDTLVGKLVAGTSEENIIVDNIFNSGDEYNIMKKTPNSVFQYGFVYCSQKFGIWIDSKMGYIFVTPSFPEGSGNPIYALTKEDNTANYIQIRQNEKTLKMLMDMYYMDVMRFASVGLRDKFLETMNLFGVR